ncbi:MAG: 3-oxoacyl-ACP reductase FabG [Oscillospiraceae bacterium]|nr:3-oxoacyl-ACP reductase FabG [Oscillospiraceae bacterium]
MNSTVLITGSSNGIGAATAILFAEHNYNVIINYNNSSEAALLLKNSLSDNCHSVIALQADVRSRSQVEKMVDNAVRQFGKIDVLVNNAGIAQQKLFTDISNAEWDNVIATNLTGAFNCCQAVLPAMIKRHSGNIINISSVWGETGASCEVPYSAAKAGLIGMTKALAKEVGPSGIRVNCVAPGVIQTRMNANLSVDDLTVLMQETPLGRIGDPTDIAKSILFLSSEDSNFITGQVLNTNGGIYI